MPRWLRRCVHTHTQTHVHTHTHTQSPFPPLTHTQESSRASTLTREDGGFMLAGKQRREKAKTIGRGGKVPAEGCLCSPSSSWGKGAETASCKVTGVSSAASTQIFTHKQHITQQLPFVRHNGSGSSNKRQSRETGSPGADPAPACAGAGCIPPACRRID